MPKGGMGGGCRLISNQITGMIMYFEELVQSNTKEFTDKGWRTYKNGIKRLKRILGG